MSTQTKTALITEIFRHTDHLGMLAVGSHAIAVGEAGHASTDLDHRSDVAVAEW